VAGVFVLSQNLIGGDVEPFLEEISEYGFKSINLAMKYHASRNLIIRGGVNLLHLEDGAHYYPVDSSCYSDLSVAPQTYPTHISTAKISRLMELSCSYGISVGAWSVFLHDSKFARDNADCVTSNAFSNHIFPNLCPANPRVQSYLFGHIRDLLQLGFSHLSVESINFAPFKHNEHHERYFVDLSKITEFLLALCFCKYCQIAGQEFDCDTQRLQFQIREKLQAALEDVDPWVKFDLTKEILFEIFDSQLMNYLAGRASTIEKLHSDFSAITRSFGTKTRFLDSTPLSNRESSTTYDDLWIQGASIENIAKNFDFIEPLLYRWTTEENVGIAKNYQTFMGIGLPTIAAIRPVFPDVNDLSLLRNRVEEIKNLGVNDLDFYLWDIIRLNELLEIKSILLEG